MASEPRDGLVLHLETCEIAAWRGYRCFEFYAVARESGEVLATSQGFRQRGARTPVDTPAARARYAEVVEQLVAADWTEEAPSSEDWFAATFSRPTYVPAPAEPVAAAAPSAPLVAPPPPPAAAPAPVSVAPPPLPAPAADAPAEQAGRPRTRRTRRLIALAAVPLAAGLGVWFASSGAPTTHAGEPPARRHTTPAARTTTAAQPHRAAAAPEAPRLARAELTGARTGSWVEVRRSSEKGSVLYAGVLGDGQKVSFTGSRLWIRLGSAGNVSLTVNGRDQRLFGTLNTIVTASGLQKA